MIRLSHSIVSPGDVVAVWSRGGGLDPTAWALRRADGTSVPCARADLALRRVIPGGDDTQFHHAIVIPVVDDGIWEVWNGGNIAGPIRVGDPVYIFDGDTYSDEIVQASLYPGAVWLNCTFINSGIKLIGGDENNAGGLIYRCRFRGLPVDGGHPIQVVGSGVAVIDCDFDGTDRGIVCQTNFRDVSDCLFTGVNCRNLRWMHNGCEGIGAEGTHRFDRNIVAHLSYEGIGPALVIYDCQADGNYVTDFDIRGGEGIRLHGLNGAEQLNTAFVHGEIVGGRVQDYGSAGTSIWDNVAVIDPRPSRGPLFNVPTPASVKPYEDGSVNPELPDGLSVVYRQVVVPQ